MNPTPKPTITLATRDMAALTLAAWMLPPMRVSILPMMTAFFRPYLSPKRPPMKHPNMAPK